MYGERGRDEVKRERYATRASNNERKNEREEQS